MSDAFEVLLEREEGYRFRADFGSPEVPPLVVDESPPLGGGSGPDPSQLLATAVGDCLSASLLFCLGKSRVEVAGVRTKVVGTLRRNERGRLRVGGLDVSIEVEAPGAEPGRLAKCLEVFEDFCVVTASVRRGLDVTVTVSDPAGEVLYSDQGLRGGQGGETSRR